MATKDSARSWESIITSAKELETSREETRQGFLEQAREKTRRATQFLQGAAALANALQAITDASQLPSLHQFRDNLIAAAGFSDKAATYFAPDKLDSEMKRMFEDVYAECAAANSASGPGAVASAFRAQIVQRYLLTRGDTLGGQMRNWTGARAGKRFNLALLDALSRAGLTVEFESQEQAEMVKQGTMFERDNEADESADATEDDAEVSSDGQKDKARNVPVRWRGRLLLLNGKPTLYPRYPNKEAKVVLNNIDMILLDTTNLPEEPGPRLGTKARTKWELARLKRDPKRYLACGELKGGIDPAGADEHWKTTKGGLERIPDKFKECRDKYGVGVETPQLFFVGAAIGTVMANDVYAWLKSSLFSHAANLTQPAQLAALTDWLVSL